MNRYPRKTKLKIPRAPRSTKFFPTGSKYEGSWDVLGMSGFGKYTFPNGVIYEGDFEDGMFHGAGQLRYPDGTIVKGIFRKGIITNRKLIFADGLMYEEENWGYCMMPDRRYTVEYNKGLEPAGRSNITAELPTRSIPHGLYDTGDGFYDPKTKSVYNDKTLTCILRSPSEEEQKWIKENCRTTLDSVLGPRRDLYEKWTPPQLQLPQPPPPAAPTLGMSTKNVQNTSIVSSTDISDYGRYKNMVESSIEIRPGQKVSSIRIHGANILDKVKFYNDKLGNKDLKASHIAKTYSALFNQNINVALATLFENPNDTGLKDLNNSHSNALQDSFTTAITTGNKNTDVESETLKTSDEERHTQMPTTRKLCSDILGNVPEDIPHQHQA